jgi:hypothetical protein
MSRIHYDEGHGKSGVVGAGHARDPFYDRGHGPVTTLHLLQQIADCLLLVLLQGFSDL